MAVERTAVVEPAAAVAAGYSKEVADSVVAAAEPQLLVEKSLL